MVAGFDPMNRGLKGGTALKFFTMLAVAGFDPMNRGLKDYYSCRYHVKNGVVAGFDPMNRGLKGVRLS